MKLAAQATLHLCEQLYKVKTPSLFQKGKTGEVQHIPCLADHLLQRSLLPLLALALGQIESQLDGPRDVGGVGRLHEQCSVQEVRRASVFGQDRDAAAILLARDVLEADEVHAVAERGDEADVGDGVEGCQVLSGDGVVDETDGSVGDGACGLVFSVSSSTVSCSRCVRA